MRNLILALILLISINSNAQKNDKKINYTIIHQEYGVIDIVIVGVVTKEKIKQAIKEVCLKKKDDKVSVGVWKSKQYYLSTNGNGESIAMYLPMMNKNGVYEYYLNFSDGTSLNKSAFQL